MILGEGSSNPLQYSCLENSMDRGAWWATVHGVTKSWTWLSDQRNKPSIHSELTMCPSVMLRLLYTSSHLSLVKTSWGALYNLHLTREHLVFKVKWVSQECTGSEYANSSHESQEPDITTKNNWNRDFAKGIMAYLTRED